MSALADAAIQSERLLFGPPSAASNIKVLLGLSLAPPGAGPAGCLRAVESDADWAAYERERVQVEQAYGVGAEAVTAVVRHMRDASRRFPIGWFFLDSPAAPGVGAVGVFEFSHAATRWARLQDVDIFPRFRRQGLGRLLLDSVVGLAASRGACALFVGADEDDWPLDWYRRRGFQALARVPKARHAALSAAGCG